MLSSDAMSIVGFWATMLGVLLSVVSIVLSLVLAGRSERIKKIVYFATAPIPVATTLPEHAGYKISLLIEKPGSAPMKVTEAYLLFVKIGNVGKDPVRKEDLVGTDPLRVQVKGANVLDISIIKRTRPELQLGEAPHSPDSKASSYPILIDFMDFKDGAIIRVLVDSHEADLSVEGKVIGMPSGVKLIDTDENRQFSKILIGTFSMALFAIIWDFTFFAAAPKIFPVAKDQAWWQSVLVFLLLFGPQMLLPWLFFRGAYRGDERLHQELRLPYLPRPNLGEDF